MMRTIVHTARIYTASLITVLIVSSCSSTADVATVSESYSKQLSQQNVDAVIWTATSAEMFYASHQAFDLANYKLRAKLNKEEKDRPMAVVMDLDETVIDNSPYSIEQIALGKTFNPDTWYEWCMEANAELLPGALAFIKKCEELNVEVFYISNRSVETLEGTIANLQKFGIKATSRNVLLKEDESDKTSRRNIVLAKYDVLLYLGDNLRDFSEIFKDRASNYGKDVVQEELGNLRENFILIPNPMYGDWKAPLYGEKRLSQEEKLKAINSFFKK